VDVIVYSTLDDVTPSTAAPEWRVVLGNYTTSQNWAYAVLTGWGASNIAWNETGTKYSYNFASPPPQQENGKTNTAFMVFCRGVSFSATVTINRVEVQLRHTN